MLTRKGAHVCAPTEHLESCYGATCATSTVPRRRGGEYTFRQAREIVLEAVVWLKKRGWNHPDVIDLQQYGPRLHDLDRGHLQRVIDDLVRTEDLVITILTPKGCHNPRPCSSPSTLDYWDVPGGRQ